LPDEGSRFSEQEYDNFDYYVFANDGLNVDVIFIDQFKDGRTFEIRQSCQWLYSSLLAEVLFSLAERMLAREAISQRQIGFHASWNWIHP